MVTSQRILVHKKEDEMHGDVKLSEQLERMSPWSDPIVYAVVATILYRWSDSGDEVVREFLVTKRLRGAAKNFCQIHHGGFIKATDKNVLFAAVREVREEIGMELPHSRVMHVGRFGPELFRSSALIEGKSFELTITDVQAEPGIPYVLDLFASDVTKVTRHLKTDGEVEKVGWFTLSELVGRFGQDSTFNYWSFLFFALKAIAGEPNMFPDSTPGKHSHSIY